MTTRQNDSSNHIELPPHKLISAGVDYLTATAYRGSKSDPFEALGHRLIEAQARIGHEVRTWKGSQYHGTLTDGVIRGVRHDTHIIRLSSDMAHEHWQDVVALANNITRIDCEVTFELMKPRPRILRENEALAYRATTGRGRRREIELRATRTRGDTLYLGRRQSEVYARFYDKGREMKTQVAGKLLRQELEFKGDRAKTVATTLSAVPCHVTECAAIVSTYMERCGLQTVRRCAPATMGARGMSRSKPVKLRWLEQAVRPSISRLLAAGQLQNVLDALGLSEYVQPIPDSGDRATTMEDE
jgi:Replication initiation factor